MRRVILAICATAVALVLLLSFKTQTQPSGASSAAIAGATPGTEDGEAGDTPAASAGPASSGTATAGPTGAASAGRNAKTVDGTAWPTIYGPVQVRITVKDGKITAVSAPEYPQETPRDEQLNAFAIPQLNAETLAADSASIDAVSGATYTSQGYIASLQSAIDKAGLS